MKAMLESALHYLHNQQVYLRHKLRPYITRLHNTARSYNARRITALSRYYESHPRVMRLKAIIDDVVTIACSSEYTGANPAVNAAYSPLRYSLIIMIGLFTLIFIIGGLAPIKSAALASGTIVVVSNKKTVQHLEGGIISEILVKEGDTVTKGQPLIELNDISPKAARNIAKIELFMARITEARLLALKSENPEMEIAREILKEAKSNKDLQNTIETQRDLFVTQFDMQESKLATLKQQIEEYKEEISGFQAQVDSADAQLELIVEEITPMKRLVKKGYAAKPQLLALKRKKEELHGNKGQYLASIAKAKQSIREAELQLATLRNEFSSQIARELSEAQSKISDNEERLSSADDIVKRTIIDSPYEGIISNMKYHTVGGVIAPGEPVMDIIPQNEQLEIEVQIQPADIDVVTTGLDTRIIFSAYKTRSMPELSGKVVRVSADVLATEELQPAPYYKARVAVNDEELEDLKNSVRLYPGMPVEVFIVTGSRSFLGYMLAPITGSLDRAFRED